MLFGYSFHPLSRNMVRRKRGRLARATQNGNGRNHHGILQGIGAISVLSGLFHLVSGLFKHHKKKHLGRGSKHKKIHKPHVTRAHPNVGLRRSNVQVRGPAGLRTPKVASQAIKRPNLYINTGVFDVRTGRLKRMRLLG